MLSVGQECVPTGSIWHITKIIFSQIENFDYLWWLCIVVAVMSFTYSSIVLGLGSGKVAGTNMKLCYVDLLGRQLVASVL